MPKATETVLEIDLTALEHNYHYLKSKIDPKTKFLGVVKAFAYGSDATRVAQKLEALGVDYLAVAYTNEGIVLREEGIKIPILVLHPQTASFDLLIERCLEPSLYSVKILQEFIQAAGKHGQKKYPVHIKFNTGLNRLGFNASELKTIAETLKTKDEIKVVSILSHLAASEDMGESAFTLNQIREFTVIAKQMEEEIGHKPFKHILNTSGIINYPEAQFDMVRSGIGLYGFGNEASIDSELKPVATLKTIIAQIHQITPHATVGYNRAFASGLPRTTATLPLGHADGIGRQYGKGKAYVLVNGHKAPIVGNVCMDMIMIDITGLDCEEGDEVIIFGNEPTADKFASKADTISYELLTGISQRVKRVYIDH